MLQNTGLPGTLTLNAGKGIHETLTEGDPDKWKSVLDLNVMGVLRYIRSFVPEMISQKQGKVIFMSSVAASKPYTYGAVYSASKAAVEMIAETLRLETLPHVAVTTINAGITDIGEYAGRHYFFMPEAGTTKTTAWGSADSWLNNSFFITSCMYLSGV